MWGVNKLEIFNMFKIKLIYLIAICGCYVANTLFATSQVVEVNNCLKEKLTNIVCNQYPANLLKIQKNDTIKANNYTHVNYNTTRLYFMLYVSPVNFQREILNYNLIPLVGLSNSLSCKDTLWQEAADILNRAIPSWKMKFNINKKNLPFEPAIYYIVFRNDHNDNQIELIENCKTITIRAK